MDFHGLDLNLLVALDALIAEKSVTKAGRRVHLSQSAMQSTKIIAESLSHWKGDANVRGARG